VGAFDKHDALVELLKGTGLEIVFTSSNQATIRVKEEEDHSSKTSALTQESRLQLVQSEDAGNAREGAEGRTDAETSERSLGAYERTGIPEILVTGTRSVNIDIKRSEDDIQPYVILKREDIEHSQASNLEDFLKTRLPMNTTNKTVDQDLGGFNLPNSPI